MTTTMDTPEVQAQPVLTSQPMSLWRVDFRELYARHLCRHSQFGINVFHLAALFVVWFGVYGFVHWLAPAPWVPVAMAAAYLAAMLPSLPIRVTLATAAFLALFVLAVLRVPMLPWWVYLVMIPVAYKIQSWSHVRFHIEHDMTEFNKKYTKGYVRFFVLLFYEVPMLLNYLTFDQKSWA